jgi:CheY-like chemotaxis protein
MKILVVEDSRFMRLSIQRSLERAGHKVVASGDGAEGLRMCRENAPEMVLLDMLLPGMAGLDVLRELKKGDNTRNIPVIILTGLSDRNAEKLLQEGASGFLEKSDKLLEDGAGMLTKAIAEFAMQKA